MDLDQLQALLAYVTIGLAVASPVVRALLAAATQLRVLAAETEWTQDDAAVEASIVFLTRVAKILEVVAGVLPHISVKGPARATASAVQAADRKSP